MGDFIKIDRRMLEWEWYQDEHTKSLFLHCLLKANWKPGMFRGVEIKRGQFPTSIPKLEIELELTCNEVRTAIKHLKSTGTITVRTYAKFSVITVVKYEQYQSSNSQKHIHNHSQNTVKSQSINRRLTTIEEKKEGKKERRNKNIVQISSAEDLFNRLWELYPCKKGRGRVTVTAKKNLLKVGYDELARAIGRYKDELERDSDWRKPQNGSTFFNSGYVDYLDANYVPDKHPKPKDKNKFRDYKQREYSSGEMESLEKQLLGGDKK